MAHEFKVKNGLIVDGKFYVKSGFTYNDLPQILVYNSGTTEVGFRNVDTIEGVTITGGTITISQGGSVAIYSGTSGNYNAGPNWIKLNVNGSTQMIQSASTSFVFGIPINVVTS